MANEWLRLWHDMPNDPKWRTIARASKQPVSLVLAVYTHLLVDASRNVTRGHVTVTHEDLASALDVTEAQIADVLNAMEGRVIEDFYLSGWEKRQPKREDSGNPETGAKSPAQRKKEQREREKLASELLAQSAPIDGSHAESRNVTLDKDKDKEEDKESITHTIAPAKNVAVCVALRSEGVANVNPSHPGMLALIDKGAEVGTFVGAARIAKDAGQSSFPYIVAIVRRQMQDAEKLANEGLATPKMSRNVTQATATFAERDRIAGMQRWEEMTNSKHPELPEEFSKFKASSVVIDIAPTAEQLSISQ